MENYKLKSIHRPQLTFSREYHVGLVSPYHTKLLESLRELERRLHTTTGNSHPHQPPNSIPLAIPQNDQGAIALTEGTYEYFEQELKVDGLNAIHKHLWMAGSLGNISPLHRQRMLCRTILITEDPELHLIWYGSTIYIKPLPRFLLCQEFWDACLAAIPEQSREESDEQSKRWRRLAKLAYGMLHSYSRLIQYPSDYQVAMEIGLLPDGLLPEGNSDFKAWFNFLHDDLLYRCHDETKNKRYKYGELRLSRLNIIYRFGRFQYVYFAYSTEYTQYFSEFWPLVLFVFTFFTIALTALQVLLQAKQNDTRITGVSYFFSVFSLIFCVLIAVFFLVMYTMMFFYNMLRAVVRKFFRKAKHWVGAA